MQKIRKLLLSLSKPLYCSALRFGVAAAIEHEKVIGSFGCRTVVDIGANRGQFALAARFCFPSARIIAFEPLPGPAATFRRVFDGDANMTLHEAAIGPTSGDVTIHISERDDSSSLLPITATQDRLFPGTAEVAVATVRVGRLSDFVSEGDIKPPALLKLDVQGYELETLKGCEKLLGGFSHVYAECSLVELYAGQALADEVIAWMREREFRLTGVHDVFYDQGGRTIQGDFLFSSSE